MATKKDNKKEDTAPVEINSTAGAGSACEAVKSDDLSVDTANDSVETTANVATNSTGVNNDSEAIKSDELDATNNIGIITRSANANGAQETSRDVKTDELSTVGDIGGVIAEIFTSTNADGVFITSDNTFFTVKCNAINHAKTLDDQKVRTFSRRIWKMLAKI